MDETVKPYDTRGSKKEQVRTMFDRIAFRYDFLNRMLSFGVDTGWRRKVGKRVRQDRPGTILDVAAGTGDLAVLLARTNPGATVTGIDLSPEMLAVPRRKAARKKAANIVALAEGDAENLPFADDSFDVVTVGFGVRNFEHPERGMKEICRVLKPGGKVYVLEFAMPRNRVFGAFYLFYFRKLLPFIGGTVSGEKKAYRYLQQSVEAFPWGDRFAALMEQAGFRENTQESVTGRLAILYRGVKA